MCTLLNCANLELYHYCDDDTDVVYLEDGRFTELCAIAALHSVGLNNSMLSSGLAAVLMWGFDRLA
jgi:hypothetical protein